MEKITFRDYFEMTRITTNCCIKISGIIFTSIFVIIFVLTEMRYATNSILEPVKWFIICVLLGNGFGLFILFLAITSGYKQVKSTVRFYNSIPENIKIKYGIQLQPVFRDERYNYLNYQILNGIPNSPLVRFAKSGNKVFIFLDSYFEETVNFQAKILELNKKYKRKHISLTGYGLKKTIRKKDWNHINDNTENHIRELFDIAHGEKMNIRIWEDVNNL
jgi:hypothetical protein